MSYSWLTSEKSTDKLPNVCVFGHIWQLIAFFCLFYLKIMNLRPRDSWAARINGTVLHNPFLLFMFLFKVW